MVPTHVHNTHGFEQDGYLLVALCPITFRLGAILLQFKNDTGSFQTKKKERKRMILVQQHLSISPKIF